MSRHVHLITVDLRERVAVCGDFTPQERLLILDALTTLCAPIRMAPAQYEWTCGHVAGCMCAECYRLLAWRAHELALQVRWVKRMAMTTLSAQKWHAGHD